MADPVEGTAEYYRQFSPAYRNQQAGGGMPPAVQSVVGAAKSAVTPTTPNYPPVSPEGQLGVNSGILGTVGREAAIALNQAGIGVAGLPMGAANLLWRAGHAIDPSDIGEAPAWTQAQGPGSYGEALTIPGLNPMTPFERTLAAGSRQVGSALPFAAMGAMGPVALGINALGGGAGQVATEAGYPNLGAAIQFGTGLGTGLGSASRMPGAPPPPMWTNVGGGMTAAERTAATEKSILDILTWEPMTSRLPFGLGVIPNRMIVGRNFRAASPSSTSLAARQILGGAAVGGAIGVSSATENAPPAISYTAPPSFAPGGANQ